MKLTGPRVDTFLRNPDPNVRAVLLYGPDAGLVRERAETVARSVCSDLHDPFRVADLTAATLAGDPARLADEAAQISLMGGRRVIRVRDAGDPLGQLFARFFTDSPGDGLIVVEAGDLPVRSTLRRIFDEAPSAAAIGCYPDGARDLAAMIRDACGTHRITIDRDATDFLVEHLGGDRLLTRAELDKLTLYAGNGGNIGLSDARAVVADSALISLDDAIMAAAEGDRAALDRALARTFQEGGAPVSVIRSLLRHLQRLHLLVSRIAGGLSIDEAIRGARPPIFFREQDSWRRQLRQWNEPRLRAALDRVTEAEFRMKLTGIPAAAICRAAMLAIAHQAHSGRG